MIAKLFKEKVKFDGRGVGMNPTQAYDEFYESVDNFTVNTPLHPKNISHANWFKHDYLFGHPNVQFHNIQLCKRTEINFLLAHPYHLPLFAGLVDVMKGIVHVDTTFDLGGKLFVTSVMEHLMLVNRKTGGLAFLQVNSSKKILIGSLDGSLDHSLDE